MDLKPTGYSITLSDKDGNFKGYLQPYIKSLNWTWNRIGGCGQCNIVLQKAYRSISIRARDDIQIRIENGATSKLVYRGWVAGAWPSLKIPQEITLDVRGYFDLLAFYIVQSAYSKKIYTNQSVSDIVSNIIDTFIVPNTPITKGTINSSLFSVDTIEFKVKVSEALQTLANLEGRVEYGVNENLVFFWYAESSTLRRKFIAGNDIELFERRADYSQLMNRIYFEGGDVGGSPYTLMVEAADSQIRYFLAEGIANNTSITTPSVAAQYLNGLLQKNARVKIILRAKIKNTDIRLEDSLPIGKIGIYDKDYDQSVYKWGKTASGGDNLIWGKRTTGGSNKVWGGLYKDQVDKITYTLSNTSGRFNIELTTGGSINEASAKINQIELIVNNLRQNQ